MAWRNPLLDAGSNPFIALPDDKPATQELPAWQREEALERLTKGVRPTVSKLLDLINVPGSLALDMARGQPLFSGSTPGDALEDFGLRPSEEAMGGWGRPLAELGLGIATDPLNLVTFGGGAASKATLAAKAAGLADDVTRVAGRNLADDLASGARNVDELGDFGYARNATRSLQDNFNHGIDRLTDDDLLSRPIIGKRTAGRNMTLRELVEAQADPTAARDSVEQWLQKNHKTSYGDVANDRLYNDIGVSLPKFLGGPMGAQLPDWAGGASSAALLDRTGQAVRWSGPGRHLVSATTMFGDNVAGAVDEGDQIIAKSMVRGQKAADVRSGLWQTRMMRELQEQSPRVFGNPALSNAVRNVIEGTASAADRAAVTGNNLDSFVAKWSQTKDDYLQRSRVAGLGAGELNDPYGTEYFPRGVDKGVFDGRAPDMGGKGKDWSVMTGDQIARDAAYQVPGGTQTINNLSRDTRVLNAANDGLAAEHILNTINGMVGPGQPAYSRAHAVKLARDIRSMSPQARASGRGLFDQHFTEDAARYVRGRERAMERARVMYDALGASAVHDNYLNVPGGGHDSMNRTLQQLDLRTPSLPQHGPVPGVPFGPQNLPRNGRGVPTGPAPATPQLASGLPPVANAIGAKHQILERINARLSAAGAPLIGIDDLANISVDQRLVQRFNRIADYYAMPEVQGVMGKFMDDLTNLWKSSVLSFPARFVRDWYSGAISNYVEVGSASDLINGYSAAKYLMQGQLDRLGPMVAQMPRYQGMARTQGIDAAIAAFRDDLGASGVLSGRRIEDVGARWTGSQTGESLLDSALPGANPVTTMAWQASDLPFGRALGADRAAYSEFFRGGVRGYTDPLARFAGAVTNFANDLPGVTAVKQRTGIPVGESFSQYLADRQLTDPILRWGAKQGDITDSINRLGGYSALLIQGVSPQEAAKRMAAAQVDFGSLTRFEKGFVKSFAPFWSYTSRTGAYVVGKMAEHPGGRYTQVALRGPDALAKGGSPDDADNGYVPKQIKESIGFSLEGMRDIPGLGSVINTLAPQTDGVNSFLNSFDVPGTGILNMLSLKQGLDGSVKWGDSAYNTILDTTSQLMHPIIRDGVELLSGRNLHTGKSLAEFEPTIQKLGRELGVDPYSTPDYLLKMSNMLMDFVPHAPRALQLMNRMMDDERVPSLGARVGQNAWNTLTGTKVTNIAEDAARMDASRELSDMLSDSPAIKKFEQKYIPEELIPYADPDDVLLYRLDRQMRQEARKARKAASAGDLGNPFLM
jgi:hypothetical protein